LGAPRPESVGLPARPFLYTLDQIASILDLELRAMRVKYIHFDQRTLGARRKDRLLALNIAPLGEKPDWRVEEAELIRWMKFKRIRYHERGWLKA